MKSAKKQATTAKPKMHRADVERRVAQAGAKAFAEASQDTQDKATSRLLMRAGTTKTIAGHVVRAGGMNVLLALDALWMSDVFNNSTPLAKIPFMTFAYLYPAEAVEALDKGAEAFRKAAMRFTADVPMEQSQALAREIMQHIADMRGTEGGAASEAPAGEPQPKARSRR